MRRLLAALLVSACAPPPGVVVLFVDDDGGEGEGEPRPEGGEGEGEGEGEEGGDDDDDGPARYFATDHSPLTRSLVERLRSIRGAHPELADDVFAKVGASNTVNTGFVTCFDGSSDRKSVV